MKQFRLVRTDSDQWMNTDGVLYFWEKIKAYVAQNGGGSGGSVSWENITGKPEGMDSVTTTVSSLENSVSQINTQLDGKANKSDISGVYRYMGSVATYDALPTTGLSNGDVYNVEADDMNYAWVVPEGGGEGHWDPLGASFVIEPIPNSVIDAIVEGTYGG